jgi:hypothetical protein
MITRDGGRVHPGLIVPGLQQFSVRTSRPAASLSAVSRSLRRVERRSKMRTPSTTANMSRPSGSGDVTVSRSRAGIHPAVSSRLRSSGSVAKSIDHFSRLVHRHAAGDAQELRIATAIPKPSLKRLSVPSRVTTTIFFRLAIPGPPVESPSTRCPCHTEQTHRYR